MYLKPTFKCFYWSLSITYPLLLLKQHKFLTFKSSKYVHLTVDKNSFRKPSFYCQRPQPMPTLDCDISLAN